MADLVRRVVGITIDGKGNYVLEAKEGLSGESCLEKTKHLELVLGGHETDGGKTDAYYDGDESPVMVDIQGL